MEELIIEVLIVIALGVLVGFLSSRLTEWCILSPLLKEIIELEKSSYLNGFKVWDYQKNWTFDRIGNYLGHGLCYEASALMMLMLNKRRKTRLVYGKVLFSSEMDHAWVEIKACGLWWAVDPAWLFPIRVLPIPVHRFLTRTRTLRRISDAELFSHELAARMAEYIKYPETSYVFHSLVAFRRAYWKNKTRDSTAILVEIEDWEQLMLQQNPHRSDEFFIDIFAPGKPVTQEIIREFVTHSQRKSPKRRTLRKALVLESTVKQCRAEATNLHERTGNKVEATLTSLKTFKIIELVPSV